MTEPTPAATAIPCDATDCAPDCASDYASARAAFRAAANRQGARVESVEHPGTGLNGEALATDLAWIGAHDAPRVVLSLSGTHGVEGLLGSACQVAMLSRADPARLPPGTALAFVHAVNPYGFSWLRRVDDANIDVNRNVVDFAAPPVNPGYATVHDLLLPDQWDAGTPDAIGSALRETAARIGLGALTEAITGGQYTHPQGLFFGGQAPSWSSRTIESLARRHLGHARALCVLDHHTGLGPRGHTELICRHPVGSRALALARAWWGADVTAAAAGETESRVLGGNLREGFEGWCPQLELVVAIALEVGTVPGLQVVGALAADNWLHQRGDPRSPLGERIRGLMRDTFAPDDPAWRARGVARALQVIDQALAGLAAEPC
jgi:hypothetical protein